MEKSNMVTKILTKTSEIKIWPQVWYRYRYILLAWRLAMAWHGLFVVLAILSDSVHLGWFSSHILQ